VDDDISLFREAHRILRPQGVLCVTVPAYRWLWSAEDDLAGHHRRYTLRQLHATLSRCSFVIHFQTYFFAPLVVPIFLARSLPRLVARRSAAEVERSAARQHVPSHLLRRAIHVLLAPELRRIREGRSLPLGTSCLVVARRA
jgi:hypothetical protein